MEPYLFDSLPEGPFSKLRKLIAGVEPAMPPLDMSIGEPKHDFPDFVASILAENIAGFGKYPNSIGIEPLREATANWLNKRFSLDGLADKDKHIAVLNGTREGLFNAALMATKQVNAAKPVIAMPDPFYQVYAVGALASQADIIFLPTPKDTGFLPDITKITEDEWQRMSAFFICSPANPQGVFADATYFAMLIAMARKYDFYIFSDECYSEIYNDEAPISALEIAAMQGNFDNVVSFFSLSKRSSLPGLRSGFCAGDASFMQRFKTMRNVAAPQVPLPLQMVSAALWADEQHVVASRNLYRQKFELVAQIIGTKFNYSQPQGGFFLWLDVAAYGGGVQATKELWQHCGVKGLPGAYLSYLAAQNDPHESASDYVRLALVGGLDDTQQALNRIMAYYSKRQINQ